MRSSTRSRSGSTRLPKSIGAHKPNGDDVVETKSRVGLYFHILSRLLAIRGATRRRTRETAAASPGAAPISCVSSTEDKDPLNGGATTTTWRLRDRQEISYPFNRKKLTADGAVYATGDVELFVLLGDASDPRFNHTACARASAIGATSAGASKRSSSRMVSGRATAGSPRPATRSMLVSRGCSKGATRAMYQSGARLHRSLPTP